MKEDNLRVVVVCGELGTDNPSVYSLDVVEGLLKKGCSVRFIHSGVKIDGMLSELEKEYSGSERLKVLGIPGLRLPFLTYYRQHELRKKCESFRPGIIHATGEFGISVASNLASSLQVPYVITCHSYDSKPPYASDNFLAKGIVVSEALRVHMVNKCKHPKEKMTVIPNGINLRKYDAVFSVQEGKVPVIGGFGRMLPRKGFSFLLKAVAALLKKGVKCHLILAGEGPEEGSLRELSRTLGITEYVTFSKYPFRAHSIIKEMDVFVLSSIEESLGFSALEAMAYGKPVVAFGVGGVYSFMKDGETGILVNNKDVDGLASAIEALIDNPSQRKVMGSAGRKIVEEKYALDVVMEKMIQLYKDAIADFRLRGKNA